MDTATAEQEAKQILEEHGAIFIGGGEEYRKQVEQMIQELEWEKVFQIVESCRDAMSIIEESGKRPIIFLNTYGDDDIPEFCDYLQSEGWNVDYHRVGNGRGLLRNVPNPRLIAVNWSPIGHNYNDHDFLKNASSIIQPFFKKDLVREIVREI